MYNFATNYDDYMPRVGKHILILIPGLLWSMVGLMLISIASEWLADLSLAYQVIGVSTSLISGSVITYFGFSRIAFKNIERINNYQKNKICIWAFQKWSSYLLIIFMMSLGIFLRNTTFFPRILLLIIYFSIGLALFLSSMAYYRELLHMKKEKHAES
ncbi:hypothetical protein [Lentimicrobium sp. S6]|uniref:hypothetical protein n=1 Tax=Lentimicrobium sp. S6 TaxID=2735872 RepID=UPI00155642DF|nr:hypothetical protein [Lentimicrobium sp. S6]NPD45712.1 hypothetical protein [Lentimicrobium sp. S6]